MSLMVNIHPREYKSEESITKVLLYITRNRSTETRQSELLCWGDAIGYNYGKSIFETIDEFLLVQNIYERTVKKNTSKICHYVYKFIPSELIPYQTNLNRLANFSVNCCQYLFNNGHQSVFAIHHQNGKTHIHFCINTVNFKTFKKLRQYPVDLIKSIETPFYSIFQQFYPNCQIGSNFII